MKKFNVAWPNGRYINFFDSLDLMKKVKDMSNGNLTKISLNACLDYFFQEEQASPHSAFWGTWIIFWKLTCQFSIFIFILGSTCNSTFEIWTFQMLMIVDAFANMEPKNLDMDHINITFLVITIWTLILVLTRSDCQVTYQHKKSSTNLVARILGNLKYNSMKILNRCINVHCIWNDP